MHLLCFFGYAPCSLLGLYDDDGAAADDDDDDSAFRKNGSRT